MNKKVLPQPLPRPWQTLSFSQSSVGFGCWIQTPENYYSEICQNLSLKMQPYLLLKLCKLVLVLWNLLQRWLDAEGTMHLFLTKIFWSRLLAKKINYPTWKNITADTSTSNVYNNTRRPLVMQIAATLTIFHEGHLQRYSAHLSKDEVIRKAQ